MRTRAEAKIEADDQSDLTARKQDDDQWSFIDVPAEIRNLIYSACLVLDHPVRLKRRSTELERARASFVPCGRDIPLKILLCSKAIHREAAPILYGLNTFELSGLYGHGVSSFLREIPSYRRFLRHVSLTEIWWQDALRSSCRYLKDCKQLQSLTIDWSCIYPRHGMQAYCTKEELVRIVGSVMKKLHQTRPSMDVLEVLKFEPLSELRKRSIMGQGDWVLEEERVWDEYAKDVKEMLATMLKEESQEGQACE